MTPAEFPALRLAAGLLLVVIAIPLLFAGPYAGFAGLALLALGSILLLSTAASLIRGHPPGHREQPRYLCVNCGYDARGIDDWKCPECGTVLTGRFPDPPTARHNRRPASDPNGEPR